MTEENNNQATPENLIERAKKERELLHTENERMEKNIKEMRDLEAQRLLGSTAGTRSAITPLTDEEFKQQEAKRLADEMAGAFRRKR